MRAIIAILGLTLTPVAGCGDDGSTEADRVGVAAECISSDDCPNSELQCLTQFKGGYCGLTGCAADADCPAGAACIAHVDGKNYCFRVCIEKIDCNRNRAPDVEANCSANIDFAQGGKGGKACVPPSG
ncbi:MAG: hypothetical protein OEZ06_06140 [Myxococcales bacterium]|nr:hypothetical protein [Myxococcales bacterium]